MNAPSRAASASPGSAEASFSGSSRALARRLQLGILCFLAPLGLLACGGEPSGPARYAVVERGLKLVATETSTKPHANYDVSYAPAEDHSWRFSTPAEATPEGFVSRAAQPIALIGPDDGSFDAELHQHLRVRVRLDGTQAMNLAWRSHGQDWSEGRQSSPMLAPTGDDWQTIQFELLQMRGSGGASDVSEGADEFRILFLPAAAGQSQSVEVSSLELVSDFDDGGAELRRVSRLGTQLRGQALPAEGVWEVALQPGPRDRLRLGLAALGAPLNVELRDADGRLPPTHVALEPGRAWHDVRLDLSPLEGRASRLQLAIEAEPGALLLAGALMRLAPETEAAPDLILYVEDTLRADRLGSYGYPFPTDPALQQLAAQGVLLEQVFAASSWTRPSLSSIFSSLHPGRHGNRTHYDRLSESVETLAEVLAEAGWVTRSFVTNYHGGEWAGLAQGFDHVGEPTAYGAASLHNTLTSELVAGPIEEFLAEHADERVFVHVHTLDPHAPYLAPAELRAPFLTSAAQRDEAIHGPGKRQREKESIHYDAEILHNDQRLARLDASLGARRDDTLLVFLSDHGEAWQEHGQLEHRESLYQEEVHVPWVLRWPAGLPGGRRLDAPVAHIDVAPTLSGLLGITPPLDWQGRDLSGWLRGESAAPPEADRPLLLDLVFESPRGELRGEVAVVHDGHKLLLDLLAQDALRPRALFNLDRDPAEQLNLIEEPESDEPVQRLLDWARARLEEDRSLRSSERSTPMTSEQCETLRALGYIEGDC